jgi:hypothetical protein
MSVDRRPVAQLAGSRVAGLCLVTLLSTFVIVALLHALGARSAAGESFVRVVDAVRRDLEGRFEHFSVFRVENGPGSTYSDGTVLSSLPTTRASSSTACTQSTAAAEARDFNLDLRLRGAGGSACPAHDWMARLRDADFALAANTGGRPPRRRIVLNVGANKGYLAAAVLGLWWPGTGAAPRDLAAHLRASPLIAPQLVCGMCRDCESELPLSAADAAASALAAVATPPAAAAADAAAAAPEPPVTRRNTLSSLPVTVHAIEPQPSNFALLRSYASLLEVSRWRVARVFLRGPSATPGAASRLLSPCLCCACRPAGSPARWSRT